MKDEKEIADFELTKEVLLNLLLDMDSGYFSGIHLQMLGIKTRLIKTLWNEN